MSQIIKEYKSPASVEALLHEKLSKWSEGVFQIAHDLDANRGGTGFIIAPGVMMTCSHVIPDKDTARKIHLLFHTLTGTHRVRLDPDSLFETSPSPGDGEFSEENKLDFTVVAIAVDDLNPEIAKLQEKITSIFQEETTGPTVAGMERISIIHYPALPGKNKRKMIGFNEFKVEARDQYNLGHHISTEGGSSGAPLFDKHGKLIGIHRMGKKGESYGFATPIEPILTSLQPFQEQIESRIISAPEIPKHLQLADPYDYFINRTQEMKVIQEHLEKNHKIVLYGPGGIGKSELALQYANNHLEDYWLIWTFSSATPESLERDYRMLALELNLPFEDRETTENIILKVHVRLSRQTSKPWLLIYEDFDRSLEHLNRIQLPSTRQGHLIFTSHARGEKNHSLEIQAFSQEHGRELVSSITEEEPSPAMDELIELCGCYPLMLSRAAIYISRTGKTIEKYLKKFPHREDLLRRPPDERYQKTFEEIVQQTLQLLPSQAQEWIKACSLLGAWSAPISYLKAWLEISCSEENMPQLKEDVLISLNEHAIQRKQGKQLIMHRLFADVPIAKGDEEFLCLVCDFLLKQAEWDFDGMYKYQSDLVRATTWKGFALRLIQYENFERLDQEKQASIFFFLGEVFYVHGQYKEALQSFNKALKTREKHSDLIQCLHNIALCNEELGQFEGALEMHDKALKIAQEKYGENHVDVARSMCGVARYYYFQGKWKKALELHRRALKIRIELLGENDVSVASSFNSIGQCYLEQRKLSKALEAHKNALKIRKNVYGDDHLTVSQSTNNIALCYFHKGQLDKALVKHEKSLEIRLKVCGKDHPEVVVCLNNIAVCYQTQGQIGKALEMHKKSLKTWTQLYGEDHPDVALSLSNIVFCHYNLGQLDEALTASKKALATRLKIYGEEHPDVAESLHQMAMCYLYLGNLEKAKEKFEKALALRLNILGEKHPDVASSWNGLGAWYQKQKNLDMALKEHEKALAIRLEVYGEEHATVANSLSRIGECYQVRGEIERALNVHERAKEIRLRVFGEQHPDVALSLENLAHCHFSQRNFEKALEEYEKALEIWKTMRGEDHSHIAFFLRVIGFCYKKLGNREEAKKAFREARSVCGKTGKGKGRCKRI